MKNQYGDHSFSQTTKLRVGNKGGKKSKGKNHYFGIFGQENLIFKNYWIHVLEVHQKEVFINRGEF
jgi:hypothetical protein